MAIVYMNRVDFSSTKYSAEGYNQRRFEFNESKAAAGNGNTIVIPPNIKGIAVTLEITAGNGKVQATTSSLADVLAGAEVWVDWSKGAITATAQDYVMPCTALRLVNISGTTKITLVAE